MTRPFKPNRPKPPSRRTLPNRPKPPSRRTLPRRPKPPSEDTAEAAETAVAEESTTEIDVSATEEEVVRPREVKLDSLDAGGIPWIAYLIPLLGVAGLGFHLLEVLLGGPAGSRHGKDGVGLPPTSPKVRCRF